MVKEIDKQEDFKKNVLGSDKVSVVDFWAEWCGPCKALAPIFESVSEQLKDKVNFYKVNVDEASEIASEYNIMSIPTLLIFKNGEVFDQMTGFMSKDEMKSNIEASLD